METKGVILPSVWERIYAGKLTLKLLGKVDIFSLFPHSNLKLHIEKTLIHANLFTQQCHLLEFILRNLIYLCKDLTTQMFTEALTMELKNWNQPPCPAIRISLNKLWNIHLM